MQVYKATFHVFADSESEVAELEQKLYNFVASKREQGIAVRADKLASALEKFKDNYFVNRYLAK